MKKRNGTIDFMKFIFTMCIVGSHLYTMILKSGGRKDLRFVGHISVEFFFIVSGFLLALSCMRMAEKSEYNCGTATAIVMKRKFLGLYPVFLVSFVLKFTYELYNQFGGFRIKEIIKAMLQSASSFGMLQSLGLGEAIALPFAWYISALLMVSMILFPLAYRYKDTFFKVIAPLIVIGGYAYLMHKNGKILVLQSETDWNGITYDSTIRALAGVSLGMLCYHLCGKLKAYQGKMTRFGVAILSMVELAAFAFPICYMRSFLRGEAQPFVVLCFAIATTLAFSELGISTRIFSGRIFNFLGEFSYAIYLSQWVAIYVCKVRWGMVSAPRFFLEFFVTLFVASAVIYLLAKLLVKVVGWIKNVLGKAMIIQEQ
ncbi:MAG: acyltransferase family protein [Lachnospiraceae bacterium]|nr:acyltransferase family protein [Lachnospiraceae bacterium]